MGKRTREFIRQLTLEEKCKLCAQDAGGFGRVGRLGLSGSVPQDNPRNGEDYFLEGAPKEGDGKYHPVAFPSDAALSMSWDENLVYETGKYFALECRANPVLVNWLFRPGANIKRSPLCGRNFEYFSEDPVLSGELAGSYINGVQSEGVAATLKHFICNNQEFERMTTNAVVSERALREVYLKPFEIALKKGNPWSVMTSYNQVNGEWVNSNQEVMNLLRKDLGYDGVVVSDFLAVHKNKVEAHKCGMDLELAPVAVHSQELLEAVKDGCIEESMIDKTLERVFDLCEKVSKAGPVSLNMEEMHEKARETAEQTLVLLKNNGILPLSNIQDGLLVVGALAQHPTYMGGGSGHMNGYKIDIPLEKIRHEVPGASYVQGYDTQIGFPPIDHVRPELVTEAVEAAKKAEVLLVFVGPYDITESEGYDRKDIQLPESQRLLLQELGKLNKKIVLVVSCGSVVDLRDYQDMSDAVLYSALSGEAFGGAVSNVLFGKAEPGGRLAETFPMYFEHTPAYLSFTPEDKNGKDVVYGEDLFVGYRWYEARKLPVLYPFGYGLSYTEFAVSGFKASSREITPEDELTVSCKIKNIGKRAGSQVLQVYVRDDECISLRPEKELKAFRKVWLEPGEEQTVSMQLGKNAFQFFDTRQNRWIVEDGAFTLMLCTDVQTVVAKETIFMTGGDIPFVYDEMTPLVWYVNSPKFQKLVKEKFPPQFQFFVDRQKNSTCPLIVPLPFYKLAEPLQEGAQSLTKEAVDEIIRYMNS